MNICVFFLDGFYHVTENMLLEERIKSSGKGGNSKSTLWVST